MTILECIALISIGVFAGFTNVLAAGGSMVTIPLLMFMGLDGTTANGTNRVAIIMQSLTAVSSYKRANFLNFKLAFKLAAVAVPGAILGVFLAVDIDDDTFKKTLIVIIGLTLLGMILPDKVKQLFAQGLLPFKKPWLLYPLIFAIGFYGGFIQVGVGFLFIFTLSAFLSLPLSKVSPIKVFVTLIYMLPATVIFAYKGFVDLKLGLLLGIGNATGAYIGSKVAIKQNEGIIHLTIICALLVVLTRLSFDVWFN